MRGAFLTIDGQRYFFLIEDYWFLHVLFFGKLLYYFIYRFIRRDIFRVAILLAMMVCGFTIFAVHSDMPDTYHYSNYLHYKDLLCMIFFLWVGNYCRRKNLFEYIKGMKGLDELLIAPVIISHGGNAISPLQIPAYLYYVLLGSFLCFGIMYWINKCSLLEYFGRNSLVVYCMHFLFLGISVKVVNTILPPVNIISALLFIISSLGLVLLLCSVIIYLTKYKPFNYLIGKF